MTFFHVGRIQIELLQNYTTLNLDDHLGDVKNKPWLPLQQIKEELVNCLDLSYGSVSSNEFKYDKGLYGWMNIMKFSCTPLNQHYILYGMAFTRARFRLKQVYLRRQNTYWTTSGRSIAARDAQRIADVFAIRYSNFVMENIEDELEVVSRKRKGNHTDYESLLQLNTSTYEELLKTFHIDLHHTPHGSEGRMNTFSTMAIPIKIRLMVLPADKVHTVVLNLSNELNDTASEMLETCSNQTCAMFTRINDTVEHHDDQYSFTMEKVFVDRTDDKKAIIAYQTSHPYFKFDSHKRKTAHGVVDVKQEFSDEAQKVWMSLIEQQSSSALLMHWQALLHHENATAKAKFC